jgi:hypothetical protein
MALEAGCGGGQCAAILQVRAGAWRTIEISAVVASAACYAAIRSAHARLWVVERDLSSLRLTNAQLHKIIRDSSAAAAIAGSAKATGGSAPGDGAEAHATGLTAGEGRASGR